MNKEVKMNFLRVICQLKSEWLLIHRAQHLASLFNGMKCFRKWMWVVGWMNADMRNGLSFATLVFYLCWKAPVFTYLIFT